MLKEPLNTVQNILSESVGPMATFVMKEQMNAAGVDPINPDNASMLKMVDLIEERCLLRLLTPAQSSATARRMKEAINKNQE